MKLVGNEKHCPTIANSHRLVFNSLIFVRDVESLYLHLHYVKRYSFLLFYRRSFSLGDRPKAARVHARVRLLARSPVSVIFSRASKPEGSTPAKMARKNARASVPARESPDALAATAL